MKRAIGIVGGVALLALVACESDRSAPAAEDDPVLARVGSSDIRQSQLDLLIDRLPSEARDDLSDETRRKLIDSLVRMRVLAQAAEEQMSDAKKRRLNARVQAHRDELLAQRYLTDNTTPEPVSGTMVREYYDTHRDEFTESGRAHIEYLVAADPEQDESARRERLAVLSGAGDIQDWKAYAESHGRRGTAVEYKTGKLKPSQIPAAIRKTVEGLEPGAISGVVNVGKMYRIKLLDRQDETVRPLAAVSADIRKKLAPVQLKKSLDEAVQQLLKNTEIEYAE